MNLRGVLIFGVTMVVSLERVTRVVLLPSLKCLSGSADGDYTVTIMTKATLSYYGTVHWEPPVIFKSFCEMEVEFFPFDIQHCHMKLGPWSDDRSQVHDFRFKKTNLTEKEVGMSC